MRYFLIRLLINAAALAVAAAILPGIHIIDNAIGTLLLVALIFGVINALVKPLLVVMSCPLIIITLGLFTLIINGALLLVTDAVAGNRFDVDSFGWAVLGGLVVSVTSGILEAIFDVQQYPDDEDE